MKKAIFCMVAWKYENEKYERFSMDKEKFKDFKEYVNRNFGKIIQKKEVNAEDCTQGFQTQAKRKTSGLTTTEKIILASGRTSITK